MTLIATYINKFGIVHASDSNLTSDKGNSGFGQKVFPIAHLNSALSYSGSYSVNGISVDKWMNDYIQGSFFTNKTLKEFSEQLRDRLSTDMRDYELSAATIIHISGYSEIDYQSHLEFWHISNTTLGDDGNYTAPKSEFHVINDFNSHLNLQQREQISNFDINLRNHQFYINGFPPGRISYMIIKSILDMVLNDIWTKPDWSFRRPNNLFETSIMIKLYFEFINRLFIMSDYKALYIGGEIQTHLIPAPQNLIKE
jgi:hypothetical protein